MQAIIFDLDGVIIDSEALHNRAVAAAATAFGVALPAALFDEFMGKPDEVLLAHVSQHYLQRSVTVDDLLAVKQRVFLSMLDQLRPIPGALAFIQAARASYRAFALATSSLGLNQRLAFDAFDLHRYFDVVVTAEDVEHTKPDPEPYQRAVERLGLPAASCLVIEDSVNGILSAKGAGCPVVGLTTSYPAAVLWQAGADQVCASYAELAEWLTLKEPVA